MNRPTRLACLLALFPLAMPALAAGDPPAPAATPAAVGAGAAPRANASTRQALETLLSALPAGVADGVPRQRVAAQRNESVESVIRRTMADSPFKEAFLRGVFLEINAAALQPGTTRFAAGAQVQVPTVADLREHLQRVIGPQPGGNGASAASASAPGDRRAWVRFP